MYRSKYNWAVFFLPHHPARYFGLSPTLLSKTTLQNKVDFRVERVGFSLTRTVRIVPSIHDILTVLLRDHGLCLNPSATKFRSNPATYSKKKQKLIYPAGYMSFLLFGGGGIRTHESLRTPHFKCGGINHYPTPPMTILRITYHVLNTK